MDISRKTARWVSGIPLAIAVAFQLWVLFNFSSNMSIQALPYLLLGLGAPYIWAFFVVMGRGNPLVSLAITLPSSLVYFWSYYSCFVIRTANICYAIEWIVALLLSGLCVLVTRKFIGYAFHVSEGT